MSDNKIKHLWEIVYNCPFILLIVVTGLFAVPFFDRIEDRECDNKIAVSKFMNEGVTTAAEGEDTAEKCDKILKDNLNIEQETNAEDEKNAGEADVIAKNEGTRKENISQKENITNQNNDTEMAETGEKYVRKETHATEFIEYTPVETNSRYYSDAGKVALTTTYDYVLENDSYFNDAAFLGDSRTLGISDYAGLDGADFFCDNGMTIYKLLEDAGVTWQRTGEKVDMKKILQENHYGKIYIMLGMNELGYGDTPMYMRQYLKVIRQIQEWQPGAVIYLMANLHVSREKNNLESEFNNININDKNVAAARLADGIGVFYLDSNPLFTDEEGYLQSELTFDGVHLYAQHYDKWRTFLMEHGVERTEAEGKSETPVGEKEAAKEEGIAENESAEDSAVSAGEG